MTYQDKYLKYKLKYHKIKQIGYGDNILNLDTYKETDNTLYENLNTLFSIFGSKFVIKYNDISVPVNFYKAKGVLNNTEIWILEYDILNNEFMKPFSIHFINDPNKPIIDDTQVCCAYINSIH